MKYVKTTNVNVNETLAITEKPRNEVEVPATEEHNLQYITGKTFKVFKVNEVPIDMNNIMFDTLKISNQFNTGRYCIMVSGCYQKAEKIWDATYKGILRAALNLDAVVVTSGHKVFGNMTQLQANVQCIGFLPEEFAEQPKMGVKGRSANQLHPPHNQTQVMHKELASSWNQASWFKFEAIRFFNEGRTPSDLKKKYQLQSEQPNLKCNSCVVYQGMQNNSEDLKQAIVNNFYILLVDTGQSEAKDAIDAAENEAKNEQSFLSGQPKLVVIRDTMDIDGMATLVKMTLVNSHMQLNKKAKPEFNATLKLKKPNNLRPFQSRWVKNKTLSYEFNYEHFNLFTLEHQTQYILDCFKINSSMQMYSWISQNQLYLENKSDTFISIMFEQWQAFDTEEPNRDMLKEMSKFIFHFLSMLKKFKVVKKDHNLPGICEFIYFNYKINLDPKALKKYYKKDQMILMQLFHSIQTNENQRNNISPMQKALMLKVSQQIEENFMIPEDAFLTLDPEVDEDLAPTFEWTCFTMGKQDVIQDKLATLMKPPVKKSAWIVHLQNQQGNCSPQYLQLLNEMWDVYNEDTVPEGEFTLLNSLAFKVVKLTVDSKLDGRKLNIKSVLMYLQGMNIDTSETEGKNQANDLMYLLHLGIIFLESENKQPIMTKEYKNQFLNYLTNPAGRPKPKKMLEQNGGFPNWTEDHQCLVKTHMTKELYDKLKDQKTSSGFSLDYAIRAGVMLAHVKVGIVNDGIESLNLQKELQDKVVEDWHGFKATDNHKSDMDPSGLKPFTISQNVVDKQVKSTRVRAGRSLNGLSLPAFTSTEDRQKVEDQVKKALDQFDGELKGKYFPLSSLDSNKQKELRNNGNLFQEPTGPALLNAAGAGREWPKNRGIQCSDDSRFFIWVNEEDHLRIISMEDGGDIVGIFKRWANGVEKMRSSLESNGSGFQFDDHFGYIHTCPSNLGTGLRASSMILLPQLSDALNPHQMEDLAKKLGVQARGGSGEHTPAGPGGKWDISNQQRIGFTEVELVQKMINGVEGLIQIEQQLENGQDIQSALGTNADILK